MNDCLYGKLNSETIIEKYEGVVSDTAEVSIDSKNKIKANVLKTPKKLTITKNSESGNEVKYEFDGSEDINIDLHEVDVYSGKSTNETASVIVNKEENSIDVQVLKTPGTLTITKGDEELGQFNGSENLSIDIPEYNGIENDTANIYINNNNNIEVNVKALPTDNSIITGQNIVDGFGDLNSYITDVFDDLKSTQSKVDDIDGNVDDLRNQISPIQEDISNIEEDVNQLETTVSILTTAGDGNKYLSDDGQYKEISGFKLSDLPQFTNKIYIDMSKAADLAGLLTLPIVESSNFAVDWGDGSDIETYTEATTSISHQYENASFVGWVSIYGDWNGIVFGDSQPLDRLTVLEVYYDKNITRLTNNAFYDCGNLRVFKHNGLNQIRNNAFVGCFRLVEFEVFPSDYSTSSFYVHSRAFLGCSGLKRLYFKSGGNALLNIETNAFTSCSSLVKLKLNGIQAVGYGTGQFSGCSSLQEVEIEDDTALSANMFINMADSSIIKINNNNVNTLENSNAITKTNTTIFVKSSLLKSYKTATNWVDIAERIYPLEGQYSETVTIPVANWVDNSQTVQVVGSTTEERNTIEFSLVDSTGKQIEDNYGLSATQGTTQMTFTCQTKPTQDIQVFIKSTLTNY